MILLQYRYYWYIKIADVVVNNIGIKPLLCILSGKQVGIKSTKERAILNWACSFCIVFRILWQWHWDKQSLVGTFSKMIFDQNSSMWVYLTNACICGCHDLAYASPPLNWIQSFLCRTMSTLKPAGFWTFWQQKVSIMLWLSLMLRIMNTANLFTLCCD